MFDSMEAFSLWLYILPGFIGLLVFEGFAETRKVQSVTSKIGVILLFALISAWIGAACFGTPIIPPIEKLENGDNSSFLNEFVRSNLLQSSIISVFVGLLAAFIRNQGWIYNFARWARITKRTGASDPWQQAFSKIRKCWLKVRFKDGNCLTGWPRFYSETQEGRQIFLSAAVWQKKQKDGTWREHEVSGDGVLVINFEEILAIEFLTGVSP